MIEILAEIDCPPNARSNGFNCGIVLHDDRVVAAAPIVGYMQRGRWTRDRVREHCAKQGWRVSIIHVVKREKP